MPEDTTPRDDLTASQLPAERPAPGWQEPPMEITLTPSTCTHMGRSMAVLRVPYYAEGAQWICVCGQIFVVAKNRGGKKTLRKFEDVDGAVADESQAGVETPLSVVSDVVSDEVGKSVTGVSDQIVKHPPKGVGGKNK